jgi:enoyl-CoA hydratase
METVKNVKLEIREDIGIVTMDNPPENYLVEPEFIPISLLKSWIEKENLKGMLICGAGRHFSAGANLEELFKLALDREMMATEMEKGKALLDFIENLDIPVIAAIQGVCFGAGLEIALASHIRICSENALFAFPESNNGMIPGLGGSARLEATTSFVQSAKMILSGDMISSAEALDMKIVDRVVPNGEATGYALDLLNKMTAGRSLKVIRYVMQALLNARKLPFEEAMKEETRMFCELAVGEAKSRGGH